MQLAEDKQWRVRLAIIEYIPLLASQLGVDFFDKKLGDLCMSWLGDTVFSIREAATLNLKKLTEVFGVEWARQTIIPKVMDMGQQTNYLYRMTTCFAITTLAPAVDIRVIEESILPMVDKLVEDPIPNIRFNVAKSFEVLIKVLKELPEEGTVKDVEAKREKGESVGEIPSKKGMQIISQRILPQLEKLKQDSDLDVRYFAMCASGAAGDLMALES